MFGSQVLVNLQTKIDSINETIENLEYQLEQCRQAKKELLAEEQKSKTLIAAGQSALEQIETFVALAKSGNATKLLEDFCEAVNAIDTTSQSPTKEQLLLEGSESKTPSEEESYLQSLSDTDLSFLGNHFKLKAKDSKGIIEEILGDKNTPIEELIPVSELKFIVANREAIEKEDNNHLIEHEKVEVDAETKALIENIFTNSRTKTQIVQHSIADCTEEEVTNPTRVLELEELFNLTLKQQKKLIKSHRMISRTTKAENAAILSALDLTLGQVEKELGIVIYPKLVNRLNTIKAA